MSRLYVWSSAIWLFELKGIVIVLKNMLLILGLVVPELRAEAFVLIIVISGLIAHAPARVRSRRWLKSAYRSSADTAHGRD